MRQEPRSLGQRTFATGQIIPVLSPDHRCPNPWRCLFSSRSFCRWFYLGGSSGPYASGRSVTLHTRGVFHTSDRLQQTSDAGTVSSHHTPAGGETQSSDRCSMRIEGTFPAHEPPFPKLAAAWQARRASLPSWGDTASKSSSLRFWVIPAAWSCTRFQVVAPRIIPFPISA